MATDNALLVAIRDNTGGAALVDATFTIAINTALSDAVDLGGLGAIRLVMPALWTAAALTFQTSLDNVTYTDLFKPDGTEYSLVVAASRSIPLPPSDFAGFRWMKLRSGVSGTGVNQAAARTLILVTKAL